MRARARSIERINTRTGRKYESDSEYGGVVLVGTVGGVGGHSLATNSTNHPQPLQVDCFASTSTTLD